MPDPTLPIETPSEVEEQQHQKKLVPAYNPDLHRGRRRRWREDYDQEDQGEQAQEAAKPKPFRDLITQSWVMYGTNNVLLPWQILPFHSGWEFYANAMRVRLKRLQVVVDEHGEPVAEDRSNEGSASWADPLSQVCITYADEVHGFSGWGSRTERLTMRAAKRYQGIARVTGKPETNLWKTGDHTSEDVNDLRPVFYRAVLPNFVPESLSECPGLKRLFCIGMGWRTVVPVELCHVVVSGEPGMNVGILEQMRTRVGSEFCNDMVFIGGVPVTPRSVNPTNEEHPSRKPVQLQAKRYGFSEDAFLNPDHEMRIFPWNPIPVLLPYSQQKGGPKGKGKKGASESQPPDPARKINEFVNRPNLDVLARVLPGLACGTRAAFGY